ncbi:PfkB family carbohydrate kinase [Streptomyces sp. NBC_01136]|uniref:PfkB family carbohydrate kinase n=1 Tax=unclassified Streptomyces TaxID=2593676 RepID=UPI00324BAC1B|nr:PfkB family carbohydrate kinase [Streptomyces sp. NBC_01136]
MTHIAVLGSTNMDLVAYVAKPPQRGETVTGREFRTVPGGKGANQAVAAALTKVPDPHEAAAALLDQVPEVVVTLGAAGSLYTARGAAPLTVPAPQVTAVDSTGAGDTFVAALADGGPPARAKPRVGELAEGREMPYRSEIDAQAARHPWHTS